MKKLNTRTNLRVSNSKIYSVLFYINFILYKTNIYIPNKNLFVAAMKREDTRKALTKLYFHWFPFKIKLKFLVRSNSKQNSSIKAWKYNMSFIPVHIIVP